MCRFVMNPVSNEQTSSTTTSTAAFQSEYLSESEVAAQPFTTALTTYLEKVHEAGQVPVEEEMCYEVRRLQSFSGIPVQASPMRLAQSGFYATGREDEARCFSCRKSHVGWQVMDRPDVQHRVISPDCPYLNRRDPRNIPISSNSNATTIYGILGEYSGSSNAASSTTTDTLPPTSTDIPTLGEGAAAAADVAPVVSRSSLDLNSAVHPHYRNMQTRLDSFRGWDTSHTQDPRVLATAGFFYAGYSDCVRCFYCGVGLKTWEERDDPFVEHVRWRSSCSYISKLKGENFVTQALAKIGSSQPAGNNTYNNYRVPSLQGSRESAANKTHSYQPATSQNVAVLQKAVEMGFSRQMVERALTEMSQSLNNPHAAGETDQNPPRLEALIERLVITSELRGDGNRNSDISEDEPQISDILEVKPQTSDITSVKPQMSDIPEVKPHISEVLNERHRVFEVPEQAQQGSDVSQSLPARLAPLSDSTSQLTPSVSYKRHPREYAPGTETFRSLSPSLQRQLKEENRALRDETTCKVCSDRSSCVVFLPCGHLVSCAECAPALSKCPICRAHIRGTVRTYNA